MSTDMLGNGIKTLASFHTVGETLDRLQALATSRGMKIFARINFSRDAAAVGLEQLPTELLILGSPKGGTPLMVAVPTVALDLPLKALAWQDREGRCWISYNSPEYLQRRHDFAPALTANIAGLSTLVEAAARE
ncbi:MAG: DUF302 domain-containing protein [Steroidobacteraceae bacterium]